MAVVKDLSVNHDGLTNTATFIYKGKQSKLSGTYPNLIEAEKAAIELLRRQGLLTSS